MTRLRAAMSKWGDRPHWEFDTHYLGSDRYGAWVGQPAGTVFTRPGHRTVARVDQVTLFPVDAWWVATFRAPGTEMRVYVDMSTPAVWGEGRVDCVDLDLDVVELADGTVYVDDEDEFTEHQVRYGYPPEVIAAARASAIEVESALRAGVPPFDHATAAAWMARVPRLPSLGG